MTATRTSLRFVVGTALLTGGVAVAGGCSKPIVNTRPDVPPEQQPNVNTRPEEPPADDPPIVNTRPEDGPPATPLPDGPLPDVNTTPDDARPEPPTVNIRTADPKPKPKPKPIVNTVASPPKDAPSPEQPPRVNTRPND